MTKLFSGQGLNATNDDPREITQRQYAIELQFLPTALPNIATNMHIIFQVIPSEDNNIMLLTGEKCYENKDQKGNN